MVTLRNTVATRMDGVESRYSAKTADPSAALGMTILSRGKYFPLKLLRSQQNCHPDRSSKGAQWRDLGSFGLERDCFSCVWMGKLTGFCLDSCSLRLAALIFNR